MPLSLRRTTGGVSDGLSFLKRRAERIYPLYWICTTLKIVLTVLLPGQSKNGVGTPYHIFASYLLLPSFHPDGAARPIIAQGWTLVFEMLFYLLIGVALILRLPVLRSVSIALVLLSGLVFFPLLASIALPMHDVPRLLEFAGGMFLSWLFSQDKLSFPSTVAWVLAVVSFCWLCAVFFPQSLSPVLLYGLPSFLLVGSMLSLEGVVGNRIPRWILLLGDASYSIYLTHEFALLAVIKAQQTSLLRPHAGLALTAVVGFFASLAVGLICYFVLERPINKSFNTARQRAVA